MANARRRSDTGSADRQRRHHRRVVNGRMVCLVEIDDTAVPLALIAAGFLAADAGDDRRAIGRAIERLIQALVAADASAHEI